MLRLYVNGTQVGQLAQTGLDHHRRPIRSGSAATASGASTSTGLIDEVRVYNRALSAAEIQNDMDVSVTPDTRAADDPARSAGAGSAGINAGTSATGRSTS
jgi:hypothetical protein